MRNALWTTTFLSPLIVSATSEVLPFDALQLLKDTKPGWPHRSSSTAQQDIVLDNQSVAAMNALYVNRTNYPEIRLARSDDNSTYIPCTPNLLTWSHEPSASPWLTTSVAITDLTGGGPDRLGPNPRSLAVSGSGALFQSYNLGASANRAWIGEMFLRTVSGSQTWTLRLSSTGAANIDQVISVGPNWARYTVKGTLSGASGNIAELRLLNGASAQTVIFGGAQLTADSLVQRMALYETGANGLVLRASPRSGRRQMFLDLTGPNRRYTKYTIPASQTVDDGMLGYRTGALTASGTVKQIPGGHILPYPLDIPNPESRSRYESRGSEVLSLGEPQIVLGLEGDMDAELQEDFVLELTRLRRGSRILLVQNLHVGGSSSAAIDPTQAYLCRLLSQTKLRYQMPEVFATALTFEEIV